jgi:uncharacterized protein YkwD
MRRLVPATVVLAALLAGSVLAQPAQASSLATRPLDRTDKAAVTAAYRQELVPALATPIGWTGSTSGCRAGTVSAAQQAASLQVVNLARRLAGLTPVSFDPALSAKAQQAALVYAATDRLSHDIPSGWRCVTKAAKQAGTHSDIALGAAGAKAIALYLSEPGRANLDVGHRRWILNPAAKRFGSGSTSTSNALWVVGAERAAGTYADPAWVSWPTPGYFPKRLEPKGLWSLSSGGRGKVDFSKATVTVVRGGKRLPVVRHTPVSGYAQPTLAWTVRDLVVPATGLSAVYTVTVKGIRRAGHTVSHRYQVRLYDPTKLR